MMDQARFIPEPTPLHPSISTFRPVRDQPLERQRHDLRDPSRRASWHDRQRLVQRQRHQRWREDRTGHAGSGLIDGDSPVSCGRCRLGVRGWRRAPDAVARCSAAGFHRGRAGAGPGRRRQDGTKAGICAAQQLNDWRGANPIKKAANCSACGGRAAAVVDSAGHRVLLRHYVAPGP